MSTNTPAEFSLNMDAEVSSRNAAPQPANVGVETAAEIAAKIGEMMKAQGMDPEANPVAVEKLQRDLIYQRQIETLPQPNDAPVPTGLPTEGLDRLEAMQKELEAAKAEATRWKKEFGRREGKVGGMEARIKDLEARVAQTPPVIDVRQVTGLNPQDAVTAQDVVNLLMSQSAAFGNTIRQVRDEILANGAGNSPDAGLPLDMEAELVEAHPWLTDLPRPQKMRAMHDILGSAGITVAPPQNTHSAPSPVPSALPQAARTAVRQAPFIEPSNNGSAAERNSVMPERQAYNDKIAALTAELSGPYKPGQSAKAAELLAALGAGPIDESQGGFSPRR